MLYRIINYIELHNIVSTLFTNNIIFHHVISYYMTNIYNRPTVILQLYHTILCYIL